MADLGDSVRASWRGFLDTYEPLRPDLYRYCRQLTRSPWAAEDLVQDAMARAFVTLACVREPPDNPRAWLFRVASNLWLNQVARARERALPGELPEPPPVASEPRASREAAGTLLAQLSPQERAAVVLKDVFDFSLDEVATVLSTTPNAVKAALHRGRGKLAEPAPDTKSAVAPPVLDAFCAAFNARDIDRLTALLLDTTVVELPGLVVEYGPAAAKAGTFRGTLFGCPDEEHPSFPNVRAEVHYHRGEPILAWWCDGEVHTIVRVVLDGDRIAQLKSYYHAPDLLAEVCRELELPYRTHGYRYWSEGAES
jgi:RNA polymerase sigma-70 factor (ECF subfamily)